jgi:nucleoside triphosphate pyrophosphatase
MMDTLILASGSPRRQALLDLIQIPYRAIPAETPELQPKSSDSPAFYCRESARQKALCVARDFPDFPILGADTVVTFDEIILGKPADQAEAAEMLHRLSGRSHQVLTSLCLWINAETIILDQDRTTVHFRSITDREIAWYVKNGEGMDKAGGYGIQGLGSVFVESINGCFYNVVGLPLPRLVKMLGHHAPQFWPPEY